MYMLRLIFNFARFGMKIFYDRLLYVRNLYFRSEFFLEGWSKLFPENNKIFIRSKNHFVNFFANFFVNFFKSRNDFSKWIKILLFSRKSFEKQQNSDRKYKFRTKNIFDILNVI